MTVVRVSVEPIRSPGIFYSHGDMEVVTFVRPPRVDKGIGIAPSALQKGRDLP